MLSFSLSFTVFSLPLCALISDRFLAAEPNPTSTNALESSLWELYSHRQHYHASVSTLAKIFQEAFTRPSYAMEDFLDHTYGTVRLSSSDTPVTRPDTSATHAYRTFIAP